MSTLKATPVDAYVRRLPYPAQTFGKHLGTLLGTHGIEPEAIDQFLKVYREGGPSFTEDVIGGSGYFSFIKAVKVANYLRVWFQDMFVPDLPVPREKLAAEDFHEIMETMCYNLKWMFLMSGQYPQVWCKDHRVQRQYVFLPAPFPPYAGYPSVLFIGGMVEALHLDGVGQLFDDTAFTDDVPFFRAKVDRMLREKYQGEMDECREWLESKPEVQNKKLSFAIADGSAESEFPAIHHVLKENGDRTYERQRLGTIASGGDKDEEETIRSLAVTHVGSEPEPEPEVAPRVVEPPPKPSIGERIGKMFTHKEPAKDRVSMVEMEKVMRQQVIAFMDVYDKMFPWVKPEDKAWIQVREDD
jgi:hypothetical protein